MEQSRCKHCGCLIVLIHSTWYHDPTRLVADMTEWCRIYKAAPRSTISDLEKGGIHYVRSVSDSRLQPYCGETKEDGMHFTTVRTGITCSRCISMVGDGKGDNDGYGY